MSRYYVLLLLIVINVLSYVDRHMLPAFASQITSELDLSRQQYGALTGFAFVAIYAICGPLMGVLADRINPSRVIACGVLLWSAMTYLTGLSKNFVSIMLPRMGVGVGEASLHPAAIKILSGLFSEHRRATVFGLFFMGAQIGVGLAYWLAGNLGETIHWRQMFYLLGGVGVVLALLLLISSKAIGKVSEAPSKPSVQTDRSIGEMLFQLWTVFRSDARFRWAVVGFALLHMLTASSHFMQLWLVTEKGFSQTGASSLYGGILLFCAIPAMSLGGIAADWFARRFNSTRALFVVLVVSICAPLLILLRLAPPDDTSLIYLGLVASVFMHACPYGAMVALVLDHAPEGLQSTTTSFTMLFTNLTTIGTGTFAIGFFGDFFEAQGISAPLTISLLGADVIALLGIIYYVKLHRITKEANHEDPI